MNLALSETPKTGSRDEAHLSDVSAAALQVISYSACAGRGREGGGGSCFYKSSDLTLKMKVSLKTGLRVFLCTLVSYFFFLSGKR